MEQQHKPTFKTEKQHFSIENHALLRLRCCLFLFLQSKVITDFNLMILEAFLCFNVIFFNL